MDLVKLIVEKTGKPEEEIWSLIEAKRKELDYLISEEGAAHIIASELGLNLKATWKVEDLEENMVVDIFLRIVRSYPAREFKKDNREGKVKNLLAEDSTGSVRVSLWDKNAELDINPGDVIHISGGYTKKTDSGLEIRAGNRSVVKVNPKDIPSSLKSGKKQAIEKTIDQFKAGDNVLTKAALVRVSDRLFFESPEGKQLMISGTIEDSTGSIRAVFFRRAAEELLGVSREKAIEIAEMSGYETLLKKVPMLEELRLYGRVKHNEMTDSDELIVNGVRRIDPGEEVDRRLERILGVG